MSFFPQNLSIHDVMQSYRCSLMERSYELCKVMVASFFHMHEEIVVFLGFETERMTAEERRGI